MNDVVAGRPVVLYLLPQLVVVLDQADLHQGEWAVLVAGASHAYYWLDYADWL